MKDAIIDVNSVSKKIGKKVILNDISFELFEGDIMGFVGPNGAGKTTTIKVILGLQNVTSGSVYINGYNLKKEFESAISSVGAIIENPDMYMYLTGYENLVIAGKYYNVSNKRIFEVVKLLGLEKRIHDKVKKYSLGMRQRLGIALAILHRPKLLILDEPTNGLDPEGINELREILVNLAKSMNMAIIVSSHNLKELESFCNKVCIIKNGNIVLNESILELKKNFNKEYIIQVDNVNLDNIISEYKKVDENHVKIVTEDISYDIENLIYNNIRIYEVCKCMNSLENIFLQYTGGNVIV